MHMWLKFFVQLDDDLAQARQSSEPKSWSLFAHFVARRLTTLVDT